MYNKDRHSKVEAFSGNHTSTIVVAMLFVITLIGLITIICTRNTIPENITTGLIGLLGVLAGFFAGTFSSTRETGHRSKQEKQL